MPEDVRAPSFRTAEYELGRLHNRVDALESRADKHDAMLTKIDEKIDSILVKLSAQEGAQAKASSVMKWAIAIIGAVGSLSGIVMGFMHISSLGAK